MKIYCFYEYDKDIPKNKRPPKADQEDEMQLYAFTNKKSYARRFMQERNMNKFIYIKETVDDEVYEEMSRKRNARLLVIREFNYYPNIEQNDDTLESVKVLCTEFERAVVDGACDMLLLDGFDDKIQFSDPFMYKDEFIEALRDLEYVTLYKLSVVNSLPFGSHIPEDEEFPSQPEIIMDELRMFVYKFSKLLK